MLRAATGLLTLMFLVTIGVAGAALHLCAMEGLVVKTCCCHGADAGPPIKLEPLDDCCGTLMSGNQHPPVAKGSDKGGVDAPMASAVALNIEAPCAQPTETGWNPFARGPPGVHGPPLFVSHCSYLI